MPVYGSGNLPTASSHVVRFSGCLGGFWYEVNYTRHDVNSFVNSVVGPADILSSSKES